MDCSHGAVIDEPTDDVAMEFFVLEVDTRRRTILAAMNFAQPERLSDIRIVGADNGEALALSLECHRRHLVDIVEQADASDGRGRQHGCCLAVRIRSLVVKRDIARDDRHIERGAGFGHAFYTANKLPHDLGLFGIAEIHAVCGRQRLCTDSGEVAIAFGNRLPAAFDRIGLAIARRAIG